MRFVKMEGCGNDYVFVNALEEDVASPLDSWEETARRVSHRQFGIGSDGLILALPGHHGPVRQRMWNADGSEGRLCLNGLRCLAKLTAETLPRLGDRFPVETAAGVREVQVFRDSRGGIHEVEVSTGEPDFRAAALPAMGFGERVWEEAFVVSAATAPDSVREKLPREGAVTAYGVSVGNPHLVFWLESKEELAAFPLEALQVISTDPRFPQGVNVHAALATEQGLRFRPWERGSGATLACGTGAVAVFAVARELGRVGEHASVEMPGGEVALRSVASGLFLRGPVREVFRGEWPDARVNP